MDRGCITATVSGVARRILRGFRPDEFAKVRHRQGLTVSDLARMSGVGPSTIYAYESGRRMPQIDVLARVMGVLDEPIETVVKIDRNQRFPGDWRVLTGLTQPQLASRAKISTALLRGIEAADHGLTDAKATVLADLLGISVTEYRSAYRRAQKRPPGTPA